MTYNVKSGILGFDAISEVEFLEIDELFATIRSTGSDGVSFTLINPYILREYSFDISTPVKVLLDINESSNLLVYNIVVIQNPLDESTVNFRAPLIFNKDNATMAQMVLGSAESPDFGMAESIKSFIKP